MNVADAHAWEHSVSGVTIDFDRPDAPFRDTGINIIVLQPGQPSCKYHSESVQEDFLVLGGEPLLLLEASERPLRAGHRRRGVLGLALGRQGRHGAMAAGVISAALSVAASHCA